MASVGAEQVDAKRIVARAVEAKRVQARRVNARWAEARRVDARRVQSGVSINLLGTFVLLRLRELMLSRSASRDLADCG